MMKQIYTTIVILIVLLLPSAAQCQDGTQKNLPAPPVKTGYAAVAFDAEQLAAELSTATGMAINPLFCISALGAYGYFSTAEQLRAGVPWHLSPKFWLPLALVMFLIFLKDSSKVAMPKILLLPLDSLELLIEKNTSAIIALPVLLSGVASGQFVQMEQVSASLFESLFPVAMAAEGLATTANSLPVASELSAATVLTSMMVITVFVVVWLLSQAFNFLILLCPFSWLDMLLAAGKNSLLMLLIGLTAVNNWLGFALSVVIILISLFLLSKTIRLVLFGTTMSWDTVMYRLFNRPGKVPDSEKGIQCFSSSYLKDIPLLSRGTAFNRDNILHFRTRPGLLSATQTVTTGIKTSESQLGSGILSPVIQRIKRSELRGEEQITRYQVFRVRSCYRQHLVETAQVLGIEINEEASLASQFKEGLRWFQSLFQPAIGIETRPVD